MTSLVLILLVNLYWVSIQGHPISTRDIQQARNAAASEKNLITDFTNGLITLKVNTQNHSRNVYLLAYTAIIVLYVCNNQQLFF